MSEKLCELRKKGGGGRYTETSLWTNQSPSSSFATQTVTLSTGLSNYKYVMFKVAYATNTLNQTWNLIAKVTDFISATQSNSVPNYILAERNTSGTMRYRSAYYVSDTSIKFDTATGSDANLIPLEILGLNELDHGLEEVEFIGQGWNVTGGCNLRVESYTINQFSKFKMTFTNATFNRLTVDGTNLSGYSANTVYDIPTVNSSFVVVYTGNANATGTCKLTLYI